MQELISLIKNLIAVIGDALPMAKLDIKKAELADRQAEMSRPNFWADNKNASQTTKTATDLEKEISEWDNLLKEAKETLFLAETAEKENDVSLTQEIKNKTGELNKKLAELKFKTTMDGEYDKNNAIMSIHAGAGGTDAQDWAEMLLRMYLRYGGKKSWQAAIIDRSDGAEAGIKSATIEIKGKFAYGYLKAEAGVHRLVRISPFDAEKMRHTSFTLVEVLPEMDEVSNFEVKDEEIRIDVFRSSGHGGQSVNTTDSAVRIKHLPTGITVSCQNERSQLQNKEAAMKILRSRVLLYQQAEREEERQKIRGEFTEATWGNQARSYVIHPYKMVKDHRSGYETQEVERVLDGELDELIESYLRTKIDANS
ncbi:peptide chain release factor 2 [Candidatus Kuenenbacteria bacterium RIFCSPLOWO2_12_FULL_42_13]|uniref:Peptide chain release factor 2 n=2 Tax=Candidatus Kueneniibacteriota TaxID=1752740 RepID=A0A1F6G2C0_9BACT|nr:MAG: peptide chain release factor 2 [Candidatus Kuenenbacteria bacterium RIFCSPLOWO2_02_FULL_42_16]OGG92253.1 MAG: peptide chain release factor 2 [Candidatus Kuenenbacteria bacterium RIFCSPLOWO2_12_FULL_42_13]